MKCITIDDEPKALSVLRHYAEKTPFLDLLKEFRSSLDALEFLNQEAVDLIFLDISMPDLTGIEFLQSLSKSPMIIFTTAYPEYAVQSYDWETVGYLLKPIEFSRFLKAANKALGFHHLKYKSTEHEPAIIYPDFLLIKSGTQTYHIKLEDIIYIEASGNQVIFVTHDKKIVSTLSLNDVAHMVPAELFYKIHRSFIISLHHLEIIERHQVKVGGVNIPIGKMYRESFLKDFKK